MRSTKDAIEQIFLSLRNKSEAWILEGDLKGFFDNLKTEAITNNTVMKGDKEVIGTIKNLVRSGAMTVNQEMIETEIGTPQGGIVSPLLANIAFNGMETMVENWVWDNRKRTGQTRKQRCPAQIIVYADDFVVIAKERWIIEELKEVIKVWCMEKMEVELSTEPPRITNIYEGFDFLGCNVRKYKITKSKTLIKPSKESIKSIKTKIKDMCKANRGISQEKLIRRLNPIIRGWENYHDSNVAKKIISSVDNYIFERLWIWAIKRHETKGKVWIKKKYWQKEGKRNWVFKTKDYEIYKMASTKITRHIKSEHHIFDGKEEYWNKRILMNKNGNKTKKEKCLVKQKFNCNHCGQVFKHDSIIELDHIIPKSCGGDEQSTNL